MVNGRGVGDGSLSRAVVLSASYDLQASVRTNSSQRDLPPSGLDSVLGRTLVHAQRRRICPMINGQASKRVII